MTPQKLTEHLTETEFKSYLGWIEEIKKTPGARVEFEAKLLALRREIFHVNSRIGEVSSDVLKWWLGTRVKGLEREARKWERLLFVPSKEPLDGVPLSSRIESAKAVPIESLFTPQSARVTERRTYCLCPFHKERSGSFVIYTDSNRFYCFGCCVYGDSIDFYRRLHGVGFMEALDNLAR